LIYADSVDMITQLARGMETATAALGQSQNLLLLSYIKSLTT